MVMAEKIVDILFQRTFCRNKQFSLLEVGERSAKSRLLIHS